MNFPLTAVLLRVTAVAIGDCRQRSEYRAIPDLMLEDNVEIAVAQYGDFGGTSGGTSMIAQTTIRC
jgi:hypothetical protein